jgi:hypothetical protein
VTSKRFVRRLARGPRAFLAMSATSTATEKMKDGQAALKTVTPAKAAGKGTVATALVAGAAKVSTASPVPASGPRTTGSLVSGNEAPAAAASAEPTLLELAAAADTGGRRTRTLQRQDTGRRVAKSIADNFKNWSSVNIDEKRVNGLTLRERLCVDVRLHRADPANHPMGAKYYRSLREQYADVQSPGKNLTVKNDQDVVSAKLLAACLQLRKNTGMKGLMLEYLAGTVAPNQKEVVGLCRCFLETRGSVSGLSLRLGLEFVRYFVRMDFAVKFPEELEIIKHHVDMTLLWALLQFFFCTK